jgi:polyisoprenoid-binding protein YceI
MRFLVAMLGLVAASPALAADTYDIDPVHTSVLFSAQHFNAGLFFGRFDNTTGTVVIDDANLAASKISVTTQVSSISTWNTQRDTHLKSPDFFDATQFPNLTFVSKSITKNGSKYSVTGDLTIHGVTKSVTVDFTKTGEGDDPWGAHRAGWYAEFNLKRSDYGMKFMQPTATAAGIGDDVKLIVSLEGTRKK